MDWHFKNSGAVLIKIELFILNLNQNCNPFVEQEISIYYDFGDGLRSIKSVNKIKTSKYYGYPKNK